MGKTPVQQALYEELKAAKEVRRKFEGSVEKMIEVQREFLGDEWAKEVMELLGVTADEIAAVSNHQTHA